MSRPDHSAVDPPTSADPAREGPGQRRAREDPPAANRGLARWPDWQPWMVLLVTALAIVLVFTGALLVDIPAAALGVKINASHLPAGVAVADTFVQDLAFVAAALIVAGWGGRRVAAWQFGLRVAPLRRAAALVVAVVVGFVIFNEIWSAIVPVKSEKILDQLGANRNGLLLVLSAGLTCVVAPVCEEFLFRGFVFGALRNWRGPWLAAAITGALFGAAHASSAPALDLVPLAVLGFALCLLYWRTGSLLPCIAAHSINNCLAFGVLEGWNWQIPLLLVASFALLGLLFVALSRRGLITSGPAPAPA